MFTRRASRKSTRPSHQKRFQQKALFEALDRRVLLSGGYTYDPETETRLDAAVDWMATREDKLDVYADRIGLGVIDGTDKTYVDDSDSGNRLNISTTYSRSFAQGVYSIGDFKFNSPQTGGTVRPLLAEKIITTKNDGDSGFTTTGTWNSGSGGNGGSYLSHVAGTGQNSATWTFSGLQAGEQYEVLITWAADGANASDAPFTVYSGATKVGSFLVNQRISANNPTSGWYSLGTFTVGAGDTSLKVVLTDNTTTGITGENTGRVVADAVQLSRYKTLWVGPAETDTTEGTQIRSYAPAENQYFEVGATTTVYGGFYTENGAHVSFTGSGSTVQDRADGTVTRPTAKDQVIAGFSDAGLGRSYAFQIDTVGAIGPTANQSSLVQDSDNAVLSIATTYLYTPTLAAGTYDVGSFEFTSPQTGGYVTPFLAVKSGSIYTTLWTGTALNDASTDVSSTSYVQGTQQFTLSASATVYAGFYTSADTNNNYGHVSYRSVTQAAADNDLGLPDPPDPTRPTPGVTGEQLDLAAFSAAGAKRRYAFGVYVYPIQQIGLGTPDFTDAGETLDIAQNNSRNLTTGVTYTVESFKFDAAGATGGVTPFLATSTDMATYTTIWVGNEVTVDHARTNYVVYPYGGSSRIMDDGDAGFATASTGWTTGTHQDAHDGSYLSHAAGTVNDTASWTLTGLTAGRYEVFVTWKKDDANASNAPFSVYNGTVQGGTLLTPTPVPVNQTVDPVDNPTADSGDTSPWQSLGIFTITGDTLAVLLTANADGKVIADAVRVLDATNRFRLDAAATVYAGFYTASGGRVVYSPAATASLGLTDQDSAGGSVTRPTTGQTGQTLSGFSNANTQRNYAFEINLASKEKERIPEFVRAVLANDPGDADIARANRLIADYDDWYNTAWQIDKREGVRRATANDVTTSLDDRRGAEDPPTPRVITDMAQTYLQFGDKLTSESKAIIERQAYEFVHYRSAIEPDGVWEGGAFANDDPRTNNAAYSVWYQVGSENHNLSDFLTPTLLGLRVMVESTNPAYGPDTELANGRMVNNLFVPFTAQEHYDAWIEYWKQWVQQRTNAGINAEIETSSYQGAFIGLYNAYDGCGSSVLQGMIGDLLNVFWAEMAEQYYPAIGQAGGFAGTRVKAFGDYLGGSAWHTKATYAYNWTDEGFLNALYNRGEEFHLTGPSREVSLTHVSTYSSAYRVPDVITALARAQDKSAFMATYRRPGTGTDKLDQAGNEVNKFLFDDGDSWLLKSVYRTPAYTLSGLSYDESKAYVQSSIERTAGVAFPTLPYERLVAIGDDSGTADYPAEWEKYKHNYTRYGINTAVYKDAMIVAKDTNAYSHTIDRFVTFTPPGLTAGQHDVYIRWPASSENGTYVPVDVIDAHGSVRLHVDQTQAIGGAGWYYLGRYNYDPLFNFSVEVHSEGTDGRAIADAVKFHPVGSGSDVILDNTNTGTGGVSYSGSWATVDAGGYNPGDPNNPTGSYRFNGNAVTYKPTIASGAAGWYDVYATWAADAINADNAPYDIVHASGTTTVRVDQTQAVGGDGWYYLGQFYFNEGTAGNVMLRSDGSSSGRVVADAVKFHPAAGGTDIIKDNGSSGVTIAGGWGTGTSGSGYQGSDYRYTDVHGVGIAPGVALAVSDGALWHNLVEEDGWMFTYTGNAYAAIRQAGASDQDPGYQYVSFSSADGASDFVHVIRFQDAWAPLIIQMGVAGTNPGEYATFGAFKTAVKAQYSSNDYANGKLTYTSLGGNTFEYWTKDSATLPNPPQIPAINGIPVVLNPADTYQSPYISSPHGQDVTTVSYGGDTFVIDVGGAVRDDFNTTVFCDSFNDGAMPSGWTTTGTTGTDAGTVKVENQSLQLSKVANGQNVTATRTFTAQSGLVSVEWQMTYYSGDRSQYYIKDSSGVVVFAMTVTKSGNDNQLKVSYDASTSSGVLATLMAGNALKVKVVLDTTAHTATLYLDGSATASDSHSFYSNGRSTDVARVEFDVVYGPASTVRFDNLAVRNGLSTTVVNDNFNSGSMPSGWSGLAGAVVTNQALKLSKTRNGADATALKTFTSQSGIVTVEWEMTYNSGDMNRVRVEDSSGTVILSLYVRNNRVLKLVPTSSTEVTLATLTAGVPIKMKAILNTSTHKLSVYLSGSQTPAWSGNFYNSGTSSNVGKLDLSIIYASAGEMIFDDVIVSNNSSLPAGWTASGTVGADGQGVRLSGAASDTTATKTFDAQSGLVTVQWTMTYLAGSQEWFRVKDSSGNIVCSLAIVDVSGTKKLLVYDGSTYYDFTAAITVDANDTFQVQATFNTNTREMEILVIENGTVAHTYSGGFYGTGAATDIASIEFQALNAGLGELWIDDLEVW